MYRITKPKELYFLKQWIPATINPVYDDTRDFQCALTPNIPLTLFHVVWGRVPVEFGKNFPPDREFLTGQLRQTIVDRFCVDDDGKIMWDCITPPNYIERKLILFRKQPIFTEIAKFTGAIEVDRMVHIVPDTEFTTIITQIVEKNANKTQISA
jgi:hypothetical protein